MGQNEVYSCEYTKQSSFLYYYLLIIVLFSLWTSVNLVLPYPVFLLVIRISYFVMNLWSLSLIFIGSVVCFEFQVFFKYSGCMSVIILKLFPFILLPFHFLIGDFDKQKSSFSIVFPLCFLLKFFPFSLELMLFSSYCIVLAIVFISTIFFKLFFTVIWGKDQRLVSSIQIASCSSTIRKTCLALAGWLIWLECCPMHQKIAGSIPSQAHT